MKRGHLTPSHNASRNSTYSFKSSICLIDAMPHRWASCTLARIRSRRPLVIHSEGRFRVRGGHPRLIATVMGIPCDA